MAESNDPQGIAESIPVNDTISDEDLGKAILGTKAGHSPEEQPQPEPQESAAESEPEDALSWLDDEPEEGGDDASEYEATEDEQAPVFAASDNIVKLDDGTEVTVADLMGGHMMKADHTRKTQEVAAQRKELESVKERVSQAEQQATQRLQEAEGIISQMLPAEPPISMLDPSSPDFDMVGYHQQKANREQWQDYLGKIGEQRAEVEKQTQAEMQAKQNEFRNSEAKKLVEAIPAFKDEKKMRLFFDEAAKILPEQYGIPAEEMPNITNHKAWLIIQDAMKYRRAKSKKAMSVRKAKGKPRVMTPGRRVPAGEKAATDKSKVVQHAKQTGNTSAFDRALGEQILAQKRG